MRFQSSASWNIFLNLVIYFVPYAVNGKCLENNIFEYIIVGSGSTGGTIANRLSETSSVRVLLLEAGVEPTHVSEIPLISFKALHTVMDWNYTSTPQLTCCHMYKNNQIPIARGKALGGSSSLNFMVNTKGFPDDYNNWEEQGNDGWGWDQLLPYILKQEDYRASIPNPENERFHGKGGPMTAEFSTFKTPMAAAFLEAGKFLGYRNDIDYNARDSIGFMTPPVSTRNHSRCSTWVAYIQPALQRSNFVLEKGAFVTKILIDENKVATGVQYLKNGQTCTATVTREVIISAGVMESPKLLMLSGIGPKWKLEPHGIPVIHELKGVGENFQDHVMMRGIQYILNDTVTFNSLRYTTPENEAIWEYNRTGPMQCTKGVEGIAFINTTNAKSSTWPDIELTISFDTIGDIIKSNMKEIYRPVFQSEAGNIITITPVLLRPKSRGRITLASKDPFANPLIDPKLLSHSDDMDTLRKGIILANEVIKTPPFQKYGARSVTRGLLTSCNSLLSSIPPLEFLQNYSFLTCAMPLLSSSYFHPSGTCKMGPHTDPNAVVDSKLRVYGIKGLRVADASIMPNVVAAHISIPCVIIGEKISDDIKKQWGDI